MSKWKSRSFWLTFGIQVLSVLALQLGVKMEVWQGFIETMTPLILGWFGLNAVEYGKQAWMAKKAA